MPYVDLLVELMKREWFEAGRRVFKTLEKERVMTIEDIIIVGSGPSGVSTALNLIKRSPELAEKILILEAQKHPREKLCAGGMLNDCDYILQRLGLDCSEVPHVKVNEAHFLFEGKGIHIKREPQSLKVFRRHEFDMWLANQARKRGVRIQEETRVFEIKVTDDGVQLKTDRGDYFSKVIVGADGANSVVRRTFIDNSCQSVALEIFMDDIDKTQKEQIYFDFSIVPENVQGYVWQFPTQENGKALITRGIFDGRILPGLRTNLKSVLANCLSRENLDLSNYELKGKTIRFFDPKKPISCPRILLVGDAAGVDPIYGEGISFALGYGEVAAEEIEKSFMNNDFTFKDYLNRVLQTPMGRCLKRRLLVARLLYRFNYRFVQRLLWWRLGFILKWYIEHRLIDWAK